MTFLQDDELYKVGTGYKNKAAVICNSIFLKKQSIKRWNKLRQRL